MKPLICHALGGEREGGGVTLLMSLGLEVAGQGWQCVLTEQVTEIFLVECIALRKPCPVATSQFLSYQMA